MRTISGRRHASQLAFTAVGSVYALLQLFTTSMRRALSWDESIYLSQVWRTGVALPFAPSRARGITLLAAPTAWTTGSVTLTRVFLTLSAASMLAIAFSVWRPLVGRAAALMAGGLFAVWWVSIFYGSAVMPNLWSALLGVTVSGLALRGVESRPDRRWALVAGLGMALVRPPDALILLVVLAGFALWWRPLRGVLGWPAAGIGAGGLVWLVEMSVRFGRPVEAVRGALTVAHVSAMSLPQRLLQQLAVSDGPTLGPVAHPVVPVLGALWWAALIGAAVIGVMRARGSDAPAPVRVAAASGAVLVVVYVLLISGIAPRFLLPGIALLCLPAAYGVTQLLRTGASALRVAVVVLLGTLLMWNVATAVGIARDAAAAEAVPRSVGLSVRAVAAGRACAVASTASYPEVGFAAGCAAAPAASGEALMRQLQVWSARSDATFLAVQGGTMPSVAGMSLTPVTGGVPAGWRVARVSPVP